MKHGMTDSYTPLEQWLRPERSGRTANSRNRKKKQTEEKYMEANTVHLLILLSIKILTPLQLRVRRLTASLRHSATGLSQTRSRDIQEILRVRRAWY